MIDPKLIVALDFETSAEAASLAYRLKDHVATFKVGMELWADPQVHDLIQALKNQGSRVCLDLKIHDIPATVERTTHKLAQTGIDMLTVYGYPDTMYAAARGAEGSGLDIYGISVLTSYNETNLRSAGYTVTLRSLVGQRTDHAVLAKLTGLVCAAEDAKVIRSWSRGMLKIMTPGIRLPEDAINDQARVATPSITLKNGADFYVVGRPITRSDDPIAAVERYLADAATVAK